MTRIDHNTVELTASERLISRYFEYALDEGLSCIKARDEAVAHVGVPSDKLDPDFLDWLVGTA